MSSASKAGGLPSMLYLFCKGILASALPRLGFVRCASTEHGPDVLKSALRDLYRLVHPDFFHRHPEARAANERSFKLLQEYLQATKTHAHQEQQPAVPYRFIFYLKDGEAAEAPSPPVATPHSIPGLKRVTVNLPPPAPGGGPGHHPDTRRALGRLLHACGVPCAGALAGGAGAPPLAPRRLRDFLPAAAEALHRAAAGAAGGPADQAAALRGALRLTRGVSASVAAAVRAARGPAAVLQLYRDLAAALAALPGLDLAGVALALRPGRSTLAPDGRVGLDSDAPRAAWVAFLGAELDVARCAALRALGRDVRRLEESAAAALGVDAVVRGRGIATADPAYREFLDRAVAVARDARRPRRGDYAGVSLRVGAPGSAQGVDAASGAVELPADLPAASLIATLGALGRSAAQGAARRRQADAALAGLARQVERRLRLRRLVREDGLAEARFRAACQRLLQHASSLQPLVGGLALQIGLTNRLLLDRQALCIAWDFE
ncbi:hypothetical protein ACKKBF_B14260 [Auxenochlorella protothecoides x Auxenochlorella symbiontica]